MHNIDANHGQSGMTAVSGELLPCPFCGGTPKLLSGTHPSGDDSVVTCDGCYSGGPVFFGKGREQNEARAIAAWNRRAAMTAANQAVPPVELKLWGWAARGTTLHEDWRLYTMQEKESIDFLRNYRYQGEVVYEIMELYAAPQGEKK